MLVLFSLLHLLILFYHKLLSFLRVGDEMIVVDMGAYEFDWLYLGDFAGGCDINLFDFSVLALSWQQDNPAIDIAPFLEPDGVIDFKELLVLTEHWLEGVTP